MGFKTAIVGAALVGLLAAPMAAEGAPARERVGRVAAPDGGGQELVLRALHPRGEQLWVGSPTAETRRTALLRLLERERRLDPSITVDPRGLASELEALEPTRLERADRALTRAWLGYLSRRRGSPEAVDPTLAARGLDLLERADIGSELALAALELAIVDALGGWRPVAATLEPLPEPTLLEASEGEREEVAPRRRLIVDQGQLRRRLVQSMDLPAKYLNAEAPGPVLAQALRRFQRRHGLTADGVAGARTLAALRDPASEQLARVQLNLARVGELERRATLRRYVEVNIPAFELRLVQDGTVVLRSRVIVGDDKTPTPVFDDVIRYIDLNPAWYVPPSIVKEVLGRAQREAGYLERAGFVWRTSEGGRPLLVQRPGPENALGRFKFVFPNHHAVYLHDTAQRGLFGRADQALSHGCVRVEKPAELALALLAEQGWDAARLEQALATQRTRRIELADPVPVFLDYRTVDLDGEGRLRLLGDLYGYDRTASASASAKPVATEARVARAFSAQGVPTEGSSAAVPATSVLD